MKKTVTIRNISLGEGMPKLCVSMIGKNKADYIREIAAIKQATIDVVEWRMDYFEAVEDHVKVLEILQFLRVQMPDMPLIATFRTMQEGGEKEVSKLAYVALNKVVCASGYVDMIDIEYFTGNEEVKQMVEVAHKHNVFVIMSNHDFLKTPSYEEITHRLLDMQVMGADIAKLACMPCKREDVITLMKATNDIAQRLDSCPIITMSMAAMGVVTRMSGELFNSVLTFGALDKVSAPGQIPVQELRMLLETLHTHMKE